MVCIVSQTPSPLHVCARARNARTHMKGGVVLRKREKHAGAAPGRSGSQLLDGSSQAVLLTGHSRARLVCLGERLTKVNSDR